MSNVTKLEHAAPISDAQSQAEAYDSLFASTPLELSDGSIIQIPPHPSFGMLDDEQIEAYDELLFEMESYDREEDIFIPESTVTDENGNEIKLPAHTRKGDLLKPYRKDGALIKPAHTVRVVIAAIGVDAYNRLRAGGKGAADVWKIWGKKNFELQERRAADSKSERGAVALEAVPSADSE